ncbi:(NiFe) hydrogenase maturation protein HypF [Opitutus terrae PB90-1]|uniref:Carbamoyltransferase n=2 Tax=Opitutus terrae TaxID=107709 RepID=B1ZQ64_OPITP|nr:(NiFe) hydrogenase maturation protein HypF [Opitutus terrae PB90-1]
MITGGTPVPHAARATRSPPASSDDDDRLLEITGTVQGIGFRPFVARLAKELRIRGWVRNNPRGAALRIAGAPDRLDEFLLRLRAELPAAGKIDSLEQPPAGVRADLPPCPAAGFEIIASATTEPPTSAVTPDLAICADCLAELGSPRDRRHGYPFINCTHCGPRYTILRALPYDRPNTTMAEFVMCHDCAREYGDPRNRRHHAQPNACSVCGPHVTLEDPPGKKLAERDEAIAAAAASLLHGNIVAVKGIGGFHLLADGTNETAVAELRRRKHREEKPLAVMFPSLAAVREMAELSEEEERQLTSAAAPIVLVRRRPGAALAVSIAPGNPCVGAFLPYTPLHKLLLDACARPLVATSGNLAEEPLCTGNVEARERLGRIADLFLTHNRAIARPIDDSVIRVARDGPVLLRRARGFAPTPLPLPADCRCRPPLLCVGGELKSTIAVTTDTNLVLSPHIGDLESPLARAAFRHTIDLFRSLHELTFRAVGCDAHPDYASTIFAESLGLPVVRVQHHLAHLLACLLEHGGGPERVLGVAWDGTGYGSDGTIWGGEFIVVDRRAHTARRVGHLRPFRLPGGEAAIRAPWRTALGLLHALSPDASTALNTLPNTPEAQQVRALLDGGRHAPITTSAGRLFDGVAAMLGLRQQVTFEGQAAMDVEAIATDAEPNITGWPMPIGTSEQTGRLELDWRPALAALTRELAHTPVPTLAARFHATLAAGIAALAERVGIEDVVLSGGCFQNVRLLELTTAALQAKGFRVLRHRMLPPNDGGIAAGQALGALWGITSVE